MVFFLHTIIFAGNQMVTVYPWSFIFHTPAWAGCWIFFVLSGYLAGLNFNLGKYELDYKGIKRYYIKKIKKIWFPTLVFIFIASVLSFPSYFVVHPKQILRLFTCQYNGIPEVDGFSATWFVFTLIWLYMFTPVFFFMLKKVGVHKRKLLILFIVFSGCAYRLFLKENGFDWHIWGYSSVSVNMDLYLGGMLFSFFKLEHQYDAIRGKNMFKLILALLLFFVLINSYLYAHNCLHFYMYYSPTIYLILTGLYLFFSFEETMELQASVTFFNHLASVPFSFINFIASISFEFYLFHSLILNRITPFIEITDPLYRFLTHIVIASIITIIFSVGFHRIFTHNAGKNADAL